jgi:hypothetical protein
MKKLEIKQMEKIQGGIDCTPEGKLSYVGGATLGGAIFFGGLGGAVLCAFGMIVYAEIKCRNISQTYLVPQKIELIDLES